MVRHARRDHGTSDAAKKPAQPKAGHASERRSPHNGCIRCDKRWPSSTRASARLRGETDLSLASTRRRTDSRVAALAPLSPQ
eukprot:6193129-Pleurochrysis_carterae.AAC.6